jgi:hypothetical protein
MDISNDGDNAMITIIGAIDAIKPDVECMVYNADDIDNFTTVWGNPEDEIERNVIVKKYNDMQEAWPLQELREKRNQLLAETDWMGNSDLIMSDVWKTYRQALRDITSGLDTVDKINAVTWPEKPE